MDEDTRQHLEDLLQTHKRRLRVLEKQAAQYGTRTDPQIIMEVEDIQHELVRIRKELESESKFSSKEAQYNRSSSKFPQGVRYLWPIGILVAILLSVLTFSLS